MYGSYNCDPRDGLTAHSGKDTCSRHWLMLKKQFFWCDELIQSTLSKIIIGMQKGSFVCPKDSWGKAVFSSLIWVLYSYHNLICVVSCKAIISGHIFMYFIEQNFGGVAKTANIHPLEPRCSWAGLWSTVDVNILPLFLFSEKPRSMSSVCSIWCNTRRKTICFGIYRTGVWKRLCSRS